MNPLHLIKMANQIATFFEAMPDRDQAVKEVAAHIQRNWEPRMRSSLLRHVRERGDADLSALVLAALPLVKAPA